MNTKNTKWILGLAIVAAALGALALAGSASATMSGDVYGGSGTWTINQPTTLDGQVLQVSGSINIFNTLTVTNATIEFTVPNAAITVYGSTGSFRVGGSGGQVTIRTNNEDRYWNFTIQSTASTVQLENVTIDNLWNGIRVNGGTATSRYFAYVTMTDSVYFGMYLQSSSATIYHVKISMKVSANVVEDASQMYSYTYIYDYQPYYGCSEPCYYIDSATYGTVYHTLEAKGTGIYISGGSPTLDTIETHIPDVNQRIDAELMGTYDSVYTDDLSYWIYYGCDTPTHNITNIYTQVTDQWTANIDIYGVKSVGATFARFQDVRPPPENFSVDFHWTFGGYYAYSQTYYDWQTCEPLGYSYYDVDNSYWMNRLYFDSANVVGAYIEGAGLQSFDALNFAMGQVGVKVQSEYTGAQWAIDNFLNGGYARLPNPRAFSLWSVETKSSSVAAAVTSTDFSLTNSLFTGAGVRVERTFNYFAPAGSGNSNDTVFRGQVLVNNVTVRDASAAALDIRIMAYASQTRYKYDYSALVSNSTLMGTQALLLYMDNQRYITTNYTNSVVIRNNVIAGGLTIPAKTYNADVFLSTGNHDTSFSADWYKVDVLFQQNTIRNTMGGFFGWDYSNYKFGGGSTLTFDSNQFENITYYSTAQAGGGRTPGQQTDVFLKTTVDKITLRGNTFHNFSFVWGMLGGLSGPRTGYEIAWAYCAMYGAGNDYYTDYGCSWFVKTPTIDILSNTFEGIRMDGNTMYNAFAFAAGRGHITFSGNQINNSTAMWVHGHIIDYSYYAYSTIDINITANYNEISNQSGQSVLVYTYPYKAGNPMSMTGNHYFDSRSPFETFRDGWYASVGGPKASQLAGEFTLQDNLFENLALGADGAVKLTGPMVIDNNTFTGISGWAVIAERMAQIPAIDTNTVLESTNGFWLSPAVISGLRQTATYSDLVIDASETAIRMENGNLVVTHGDFGDATRAIDMRNGFAEIYSSKIRVLSGRVQGDSSITVYNQLGYNVHWAGATGVDSGVVVKNALVVTSTPDQTILSSSHTDAQGKIAARTIEVWRMVSAGTVQTSVLALPLTVLCFAGGITTTISIPKLLPGEEPTFFEDYESYPLLLVDAITPEITLGKPLAGETLGASEVTVEGYTFERGSGVDYARIRVDGGAWTSIPTGQAVWSLSLPGLPEGRHLLEFEVSDIATNRFNGELEFFVDTTAPTLTVSAPLEEHSITNQQISQVRGHVEPASSIVALNGITLTVNSRGDFFYNASLNDGLNILRFEARDTARNKVVIVKLIEFDRYPPFLQVDGPVDGLLTRLTAVDVVGRSESDAFVTVGGLPAFVNPLDGTFIMPQVALDDIYAQTPNPLVIRAVDRAGNVAYNNRTVIVDTKAPSIDLEFPDDIQTNIDLGQPVSVASLNVHGTTDSNDAIITIAGQEVPLTLHAFGRVIVLREGLNVIVVTSEDLAGNKGQVTLRITRDTVAPTITLVKPSVASLLTNQTSLEIVGWTDQADATVVVHYVDDLHVPRAAQVETVPVGLPVQYRFEFNLGLVTDSNLHTVQVTATDLARNNATATFDYTSKVSAPDLVVSQFKTTTSETFVWINGTTSAGIDKVRINGQEFDVVAQGFSVRWNLPIQHGNYSFVVSVQDEAGNRNIWRGTTEVNVPVEGPSGPSGGTSFFDNPSVQVGAGALIFGAALALFMVTLSRRRQTE